MTRKNLKTVMTAVFAFVAVIAMSIGTRNAVAPPVAPKLSMSYSAKAGYVTLNWNKVEADGYRIYKKEKGGSYGNYFKQVDANTTSYTDKTVKDGKTYIYRIRAFKKVDGKNIYGEYSNTVNGYRYYIGGSFFELDQRKDAPNGCELYSLAILLHYNGVDVDPLKLCKEVPKEKAPYWSGGKKVGGNPNRAFLGEPTSYSGWGIWKDGIIPLANKHKKGIVDLSGKSLDEVLKVVSEGHAVQTWITIGNANYQAYSATWTDTKTGATLKWKHNNHSVCIVGYTKNKIIVSDPLAGSFKAYDRTIFEKNYNWHGKQALCYGYKAKAEAAPERTKSTLIDRMAKIDYTADSITYKAKRDSKSTINVALKSDGIIRKTSGPSYAEYQSIMDYKWTDCTEYNKTIKVLVDEPSVDVGRQLSYAGYEKLLKSLSVYDGVYLYKIGETSEGKNIYSIEIDIPSDKKKNVVMYSGLVHSREQGSSMMLLAELVDMVKKSQWDKETINVLKETKVVAVPMVELDVSTDMRESGDAAYKLKNGNLWKCNADKVDLNRNFPSINSGWQLSTTPLSSYYVTHAQGEYYAGSFLGCAPEVKAMMKWIYHYVVVEKADLYMDWHQQGRLVYSGMSFAPAAENKLNDKFAKKVCAYTGYKNIPNKEANAKNDYCGSWGGATDYAYSVAIGKYSPKYGSYVFWDGSNEILGAKVLNADKAKKVGYRLKTANNKLICCTLEVGSGQSVLGGSSSAYSKNATEYNNYVKGLLKASIGYVNDVLD